MWNKILAVNSFVVMPIILICLIYTGMQAILFWVWKPFFLAIVFFIIGLIVQVVIAFLND
jgi:hypothetical protein